MSTATKVQKKIEWHQSEVARLQQLIRLLEEFEGGSSAAAARPSAPRKAGAKRGRRPAGRFRDQGVVEGAIVLIGESLKHGLDTGQIADGLRAGGFQTEAANFKSSVHALLHREARKERPRVRREGRLWKLTSV